MHLNLIDLHLMYGVHPAAVAVELDGGQIASRPDERYVVRHFFHTKILGIKSPNPN